MNGGRIRAVTLTLVVAGSLLMLLAGGRVWFHGHIVETGLPSIAVHASGRDVAAVVSAVGLLGLAGALVTLLVGRWVRVAIGVVVALGAFGALERCVDVLLHQDSVSTRAVRQQIQSATSTTGAVRVTMTPWPWVALVGALVLAAGTVLLVVGAGRWPVRSARYDAAATVPSGKASAPPTDDADAIWKALDRGEDPTDGRP